MKRTDLIYESGIINDKSIESIVHKDVISGTEYTDITVDADTAKKYSLRSGRYITVFTEKGNTAECLTVLLRNMLPEGNALVAGLGNGAVCSDSIGVKSLAHIPATAHLSAHRDFDDLGMRRVYVLEAGVTGKTGIESSSRIACIAGLVHAQVVIVIDSLACSEIERLCTTIQITDTGISPGSGVGNDRKAINIETIGVPVIAVGVPTVIDLESIADNQKGAGLMVTPRTIDTAAERHSRTIGEAVSRALNPSLTADELRSLIIL
ncbi:MAG: GPR endopeptidase [Ruminiclostridium sp.]|nr:GPR endopeptidase [Ruminiclostridium sp.]